MANPKTMDLSYSYQKTRPLEGSASAFLQGGLSHFSSDLTQAPNKSLKCLESTVIVYEGCESGPYGYLLPAIPE